jgi:O-methyltransferase
MTFVQATFAPDDLSRSTTPKQSFAWARPLIPRRLQPFLRGMRKRWQMRKATGLAEPFLSVYPYTQVNFTRQQNLVRLAGIVERENVAGACVECGVLDGGTAALVADATKNSARPVHLFDAWEGLPQATAEDGPDGPRWHGQVVGSPRRVRNVMDKLRIAPTRVIVHRGWFQETFPHAGIPQIALLHVDCDFYEATKLCLERWWKHISPGGFVQFDDYDSFQGCRKAVDEFLTANPTLKLERFGELKAKAYFIRKP